jgi:hypothetical protein
MPLSLSTILSIPPIQSHLLSFFDPQTKAQALRVNKIFNESIKFSSAEISALLAIRQKADIQALFAEIDTFIPKTSATGTQTQPNKNFCSSGLKHYWPRLQ